MLKISSERVSDSGTLHKEKSKSDKVIAGSINGNDSIQVNVSHEV
jgi:cation transport ATPase